MSNLRDSESESDSQDSDSSIKHVKSTLTNLLCNYFPLYVCTGMIYSRDLYLNKSKKIFKLNINDVFKIRIT